MSKIDIELSLQDFHVQMFWAINRSGGYLPFFRSISQLLIPICLGSIATNFFKKTSTLDH